jgi:hypothetical protein
MQIEKIHSPRRVSNLRLFGLYHSALSRTPPRAPNDHICTLGSFCVPSVTMQQLAVASDYIRSVFESRHKYRLTQLNSITGDTYSVGSLRQG